MRTQSGWSRQLAAQLVATAATTNMGHAGSHCERIMMTINLNAPGTDRRAGTLEPHCTSDTAGRGETATKRILSRPEFKGTAGFANHFTVSVQQTFGFEYETHDIVHSQQYGCSRFGPWHAKT